jgi:hypothetical protein
MEGIRGLGVHAITKHTRVCVVNGIILPTEDSRAGGVNGVAVAPAYETVWRALVYDVRLAAYDEVVSPSQPSSRQESGQARGGEPAWPVGWAE